jgi:hypothetical protein
LIYHAKADDRVGKSIDSRGNSQFHLRWVYRLAR